MPHPNIGRLVLVSDGESVTYTLEDDRSHEGGTFRPTVLMERVSLRLEGQKEPVSQRWIEENVTGKGPAIRTALGVLVEEGFVVKEKAGRGYGFTSVRPYREADDHGPEEADATASPPRPHRVPDLRSTPPFDRSSSSLLLGTSSRDEVDKGATASPDRVPGASENVRPRIGDEGYLERIFAAFENDLITESEWHIIDRAHRYVAERGA